MSNFIDFICCKLGKKKDSKEGKINDENLSDDTLESTVITEKEIEDEILYQVKQMENEFTYLINNIIEKYTGDVIYRLMKENSNITEEQVINALGWFVNNAYKDMIKEIDGWVNKNNKELITNISNMIKECINTNKNENIDLINSEIDKAMGKCMSLYIWQVKELSRNQIKSLKVEIDKSIGGQLLLTNKEFEANNINIVVLEKKLKNYTNEIMNEYAMENKKQFNTSLSNVSEDFKKLKEDVNNGEINKETEKTLDDFKEIYNNSLQKSVDGALEIAKELSELNISNYEIVKNSEIRMKLQEAFKLAEKEIDIVSPEINNDALYKTGVYNSIKEVIGKGISVKILYGIDENDRVRRLSTFKSKNIEKIAHKLKKDFQEYGHTFKIKKGGVHSKILICDNKFAIIGNYSFLSFGDLYDKDISDEIAAVTTDLRAINNLRLKEFDF